MSLFLGPIHHWMWEKIQFQNRLNNYLFLPFPDIIENLEKNVGLLSALPLEEQIQTENIHGWLQEKVGLVENSYAQGVAVLLNDKDISLQALESSIKEFGAAQIVSAGSSPASMYQEISNLLLDGMPCDRVNEVTEETLEYVTYKQNSCVHGQYWMDAGLSPDLYYQLRKSLVNGLLEAANYNFVQLDYQTYRLERRA